ncbi:MAG: phospho-N-acetylmuramoyl-pentapeptide-transferase [Solobacterium sp.]|nr:phospho-N-acetylmuramoyl-pentapeptide-transferase [Solobacterium sp.]
MIRVFLGFILSLLIVFVTMPSFINYLKKLHFKQSVSEYSLKEYQEKGSTPIMGGILFIVVPVIITICLTIPNYFNFELFILIMVYIGYGLIGFIDDYLISVKKNNDGLKASHKFLLQILLAIIFFLIYRNHASTDITLLFSKKVIHLGWFYMILVLFMFAGASNAVNLTDGMDGLAAGCEVISLVPFFLYAMHAQRMDIMIFVASIIGALLAYLYYNVTPAKVFMGDTGSLALGAILAGLAMVLKKEMALIVIAGVFVIETLCVIIQIGSVKLRHKRVFPYTPIHYAFVMKGMKEEKVVHLFWLCALIFAIIGYFLGL